MKLLDARIAAGDLARTETTQSRLLLQQTRIALKDGGKKQSESEAALAAAAGVPLEAVRRAAFDFSACAGPPEAASGAEARRYAMQNRTDLLSALAAYSGAQVILAQPTLERTPLRAALTAVDQVEGALPNGWGFRLDERGQNLRARPVLLQWQAGRPVAVFPNEAAAAAPV